MHLLSRGLQERSRVGIALSARRILAAVMAKVKMPFDRRATATHSMSVLEGGGVYRLGWLNGQSRSGEGERRARSGATIFL